MKFQLNLHLIIIILLSFLALLPLLQPGFMGYDFVYQGARLASFYRNLTEGVILPRWAGGPMNAGFGHPVLIFLYPFVFYLGSFWHWLGFSLVDSLKILLGLGYIFSGIFAYFFFKRLTDSKIALTAALFYLFIPYRFLNLYGRAALGEHLATAFLPLVFLAILNIFQVKTNPLKNIVFLALATALTLLCHNLIFLLASPLIIFFTLYLFLQSKRHQWQGKLTTLGLGFLLGLSLAAFFWFPLVFERKYIRYDEIADPSYFWHNGILPLYQIFISPNYFKLPFLEKPAGDIMYPSLSPIQWLLFLAGLIFVFKFWKKNRTGSLFALFLCLYFLTGALLSTKTMFWLVLAFPKIAFIQQAFRFLNLPLLASPFLLWLTLKLISPSRQYLFLIFFTFLNLLFTFPFFWSPKLPHQFKDDHYFFEEYTQTADTGQITPLWGLINYQDPAPQKVQLVSGGVDKIDIKEWHSQEHLYTLTLRESSQISDNTLYFPGWTVYVDGQKALINYRDMNWRGMITYPASAGEHQIKVKFEETKTRLLGDYLSFFSLILIILITLIKFIKRITS